VLIRTYLPVSFRRRPDRSASPYTPGNDPQGERSDSSGLSLKTLDPGLHRDDGKRTSRGLRWLPVRAAVRGIIRLLLVGLCLHAGSVNAQADKRPGFRIGSSQLTFGGYASVVYARPEGGGASASLRDLSLFTTWDSGASWRAFSELEIGDAFSVDNDSAGFSDIEFDVERLYLDWLADSHFNVRLGKYLAPVGRWNQVHADPLVWTVSRPLVTLAAFPQHNTGMMLYGDVDVGAHWLEYQAYADYSDTLEPRSDRDSGTSADATRVPTLQSQNGAGLRLVAHLDADQLQLGLSATNFRASDLKGRQSLLGIDVFWSPGSVEISGEAYRRFDTGRVRKPWGDFIQLVFPLADRWFGVARREDYADADTNDVTRLGSLGIAWRPTARQVLKLEYRFGRHNRNVAPDAALVSAALLF